MHSELIISTYNSPDTLWLTLVSAMLQDRRPDGLCVADDGSGPETFECLERFRAACPDMPLRHVWHEDCGFRKCAILNKAIASSEAGYLVFTDGDCLMSPGFVARHLELANPRHYACGSLIRLSAGATGAVTEEDLMSGAIFTREWMRGHDVFDRMTTWFKSAPYPRPIMRALEVTSPVRRTFCGANASAFRTALLKINGYDETIAYGGQDKELGIRLANAGITGRHLRYTAPILHMDHPRGYKNPESIKRHRAIIRSSRKTGKTWAEDGIIKGAAA